MTHRAEEPVEAMTGEAGDPDHDGQEEVMPFGDQPSEASQTTVGASQDDDASIGDAPNPMERGRSEDPPPDGVGYDGSTVEEIQRDRAERLAPENRPENSEVSNAGRVFDEEKAMFTDEPGYEDAPKKFPPASEQGA